MSTDYTAVCDTCRVALHAGQRMAGTIYSFGYGSTDHEGAAIVARFVMQHATCSPIGVRVVVSEDRPDSYHEYDEDAVVPEVETEYFTGHVEETTAHMHSLLTALGLYRLG